MKKLLSALLCLAMLLLYSIPVYAEGDPNIDSGGGNLGPGSNENIWPGGDGVRATIIRDSDNTPVSTPIDFSNQDNKNIVIHFGKVSKISYRSKGLTPHNGSYYSIKPSNTMPRIISTNNVTTNIDMIRNYFCCEGTMKDIATATGFKYEDLISGNYKILLEPIAYFKYNSIMFAMTATEAALYNKQVAGDLRRKMVSLTHKNLPLAMFLEVPDLGFPAWGGSTTDKQNDDTIIAQLGLGVVRFSEPDEPEHSQGDITYRCNTEVITSILLSTDAEKTPEDPAYATFLINGRTYSHTDIYIPENSSQLAWVKWRTPSEPGVITIVIQSNCSISSNTITAQIVDLDKNPPPDPQANDRNDGYSIPTKPNKPNVTSLTWGEWDCWWHENWIWISNWEWQDNWVLEKQIVWKYREHDNNCPADCTSNHAYWYEEYVWVNNKERVDNGKWEDQGWWEYKWLPYSASLTGTLQTKPDKKNPTASDKTMKSGYGLNASVITQVRSNAPSSQITGIQNVVAYFPEFNYMTYWRLLKRLNTGLSSSFEFQKNKYSTYGQPVHFSPVWYPDGLYSTYAECIDAWTPAGMLQINLTDDLNIRGSLYDDWHIGPTK